MNLLIAIQVVYFHACQADFLLQKGDWGHLAVVFESRFAEYFAIQKS